MRSIRDKILENIIQCKNVFLFGQGGLGKTTACLDVYKHLLNNTVKNMHGKRLVPVFIPVSEISEADGFALRRYFFENYMPQLIEDDKIWRNNVHTQLLEKNGLEYQFLFMLDGLNEFYNANMLDTEIGLLSGCKNVTMLVTSRIKYGFLAGFEELYQQPLSEEIIEKNLAKIGLEEPEEELIELLKVPFYLTKFLKIYSDNLPVSTASAYGLLDSFKSFTVGKYNSAIKEGDAYLSEVLEVVTDKLLPFLAFDCGSGGKMGFSTYDEELEERIYKYVMTLPLRWENAIKKVLIPMGFVIESGEQRYRFSHEIIRDFFAACYLQGILKNLEFKEKQAKTMLVGYVPSDVLRFTVEALGEDSAGKYLCELNRLIQQDEQARKNQVLNKNLVELFSYNSPVLDGLDMSGRDMRMVNFEPFVKLTNMNFTASLIGRQAFPGLCSIAKPYGMFSDERIKENDPSASVLKGAVLFEEWNYIFYIWCGDIHRVELELGRDSVFLGTDDIIDDIGMFDKDTLWIRKVYGYSSKRHVNTREYIGKVADDEIKKCQPKWSKKQGVYTFEGHCVYKENVITGNKESKLAIKENIIELLETGNTILLETAKEILCYEMSEQGVFFKKWVLSKVDMRMTPEVKEGKLCFKLTKSDGSSSWAKVSERRLRILKPFDYKIGIEESLRFYTVPNSGKLYLLDEATMKYHVIAKFRGDIEKGIPLDKGGVLVQVQRRERERRWLEFHIVREGGNSEFLFDWVYELEVQTVLYQDKVVIWEDIRSFTDNFFVIDFKGQFVHKKQIIDVDLLKMCSDDARIYFFLKEGTFVPNRETGEFVDYFDVATGEINTLTIAFPEEWSKWALIFDSGIKKMLFLKNHGFDAGELPVIGPYISIYEADTAGKSVYPGREQGTICGDFACAWKHPQGWGMSLITKDPVWSAGCSEYIGDGEGKFLPMEKYFPFTTELTESCFEDVEMDGLETIFILSKQAEIMRQYGAIIE